SDYDVVGRHAIDLRDSHADTATRGGIERPEARQLGPEGPLAADRRAGIGHDLRCVVLAGADDQVKHAVTIDIPHGDIDAACKPGKRDDRGDEPIAVAVVETDLGRSAGGTWNRRRIDGDGGYDVDEPHQPVVFVVEAMANAARRAR